ncbi:MAG: peroxiredoxin [Aquificae bacterium]|nr:peroxiredoxin [Aquificota bacterium]
MACAVEDASVQTAPAAPVQTETAERFIPTIGEKFPRMVVQTTHGKIVLPDHYTNQGKWFVLFSHPADFTPVCTTEFVSFQKHYDEFRKLNTELIGLSEDQVWSHIKWMEWIKDNFGVEIEFPIIADANGKVAKTLNMLPKGGTETVRAVFVVDDKGVIRAILYYPLSNGRNIPEIIRLVKALQTTDKYKVATPANWMATKMKWVGPEVFNGKDYVIVPPASSIQEVEERRACEARGECECKDWWFCYKELEVPNF